jgi:hypothetical protein
MKVIQNYVKKLQGFKFVRDSISGRWDLKGLRMLWRISQVIMRKSTNSIEKDACKGNDMVN